MNVLVIGGGGREHALCWKLAQSARRPQIFCAPGNAGTSQVGRNLRVSADDIPGLLAAAKKEKIDLAIVGPEDPLCSGIVDRFEREGLRIFGPRAAAARLEGDKAFAKQLMREAGVPTAEARVFGPTDQELAQARQTGRGHDEQVGAWFQRGYDMARHYIASREEGVVVKACGLARGKGVFVHPDPAEALVTIEALMLNRSLGTAGDRIVVEELLVGREVSVMAMIDGRSIYILETATDYKRIGDGDSGPNTGGMGAYSPGTGISDADMQIIERDVFVPIIDALRREEISYKGVLYAGLMLTAGGPKVLEFNCRLGDPETQPLMMRLQSDLIDVAEAVIDGRLDQINLQWDPRPAVCVVMASGGYPGEYVSGRPISGLEDAERVSDVQVFHAGTSRREDEIVTAGGRVLGVTAVGESLTAAREKAYEAAQKISFDGAHMRGDIAATAR